MSPRRLAWIAAVAVVSATLPACVDAASSTSPAVPRARVASLGSTRADVAAPALAHLRRLDEVTPSMPSPSHPALRPRPAAPRGDAWTWSATTTDRSRVRRSSRVAAREANIAPSSPR